MATTNAVARTAHDIGLAGWFGGALMGAAGVNGMARKEGQTAFSVRAANEAWRRWSPVWAAAVVLHGIGALRLTSANADRMRHHAPREQEEERDRDDDDDRSGGRAARRDTRLLSRVVDARRIDASHVSRLSCLPRASVEVRRPAWCPPVGSLRWWNRFTRDSRSRCGLPPPRSSRRHQRTVSPTRLRKATARAPA